MTCVFVREQQVTWRGPVLMKYWASSRAATASSMGLWPVLSSVCICLLGHKCKMKWSVMEGGRDTEGEEKEQTYFSTDSAKTLSLNLCPNSLLNSSEVSITCRWMSCGEERHTIRVRTSFLLNLVRAFSEVPPEWRTQTADVPTVSHFQLRRRVHSSGKINERREKSWHFPTKRTFCPNFSALTHPQLHLPHGTVTTKACGDDLRVDSLSELWGRC